MKAVNHMHEPKHWHAPCGREISIPMALVLCLRWTCTGAKPWNTTNQHYLVKRFKKKKKSMDGKMRCRYGVQLGWWGTQCRTSGLWEECGLLSGPSQESGVVWVHCVHTGQNGFLVILRRTAIQQGRKAGVRVLSRYLPLLLAEVESFFWWEDLRAVGLLGLRGQHTWIQTTEHESTQSALKDYTDVHRQWLWLEYT